MAAVKTELAETRRGRIGVLAALPMEMGPFRGAGDGVVDQIGASRAVHGVRLSEHSVEGFQGTVFAALSGVGKVAAAHATSVLVHAGVDAILVVGTCGGLRVGTSVGALVHAGKAIQWDLAVREGRDQVPKEALLHRWRGVAAGLIGPYLTADRPAIRTLERARRARALRRASRHGQPGMEHPVADMETASAAAVASAAGIPWAALRVVSDERLGPLASLSRSRRDQASFPVNAPRLAHIPASTIPALLRAHDWLS